MIDMIFHAPDAINFAPQNTLKRTGRLEATREKPKNRSEDNRQLILNERLSRFSKKQATWKSNFFFEQVKPLR